MHRDRIVCDRYSCAHFFLRNYVYYCNRMCCALLYNYKTTAFTYIREIAFTLVTRVKQKKNENENIKQQDKKKLHAVSFCIVLHLAHFGKNWTNFYFDFYFNIQRLFFSLPSNFIIITIALRFSDWILFSFAVSLFQHIKPVKKKLFALDLFVYLFCVLICFNI